MNSKLVGIGDIHVYSNSTKEYAHISKKVLGLKTYEYKVHFSENWSWNKSATESLV